MDEETKYYCQDHSKDYLQSCVLCGEIEIEMNMDNLGSRKSHFVYLSASDAEAFAREILAKLGKE